MNNSLLEMFDFDFDDVKNPFAGITSGLNRGNIPDNRPQPLTGKQRKAAVASARVPNRMRKGNIVDNRPLSPFGEQSFENERVPEFDLSYPLQNPADAELRRIRKLSDPESPTGIYGPIDRIAADSLESGTDRGGAPEDRLVSIVRDQKQEDLKDANKAEAFENVLNGGQPTDEIYYNSMNGVVSQRYNPTTAATPSTYAPNSNFKPPSDVLAGFDSIFKGIRKDMNKSSKKIVAGFESNLADLLDPERTAAAQAVELDPYMPEQITMKDVQSAQNKNRKNSQKFLANVISQLNSASTEPEQTAEPEQTISDTSEEPETASSDDVGSEEEALMIGNYQYDPNMSRTQNFNQYAQMLGAVPFQSGSNQGVKFQNYNSYSPQRKAEIRDAKKLFADLAPREI